MTTTKSPTTNLFQEEVLIEEDFHFRKLDLAVVDLAEMLKTGGFLVDGTLNKYYCDGDPDEEGSWVIVDPTDPTDPATSPGDWRHAIPVIDGIIHEQKGDKIDARWLWLGEGKGPNQPHLERGYMREILKVFGVWKCTATGKNWERCKGGGGKCLA